MISLQYLTYDQYIYLKEIKLHYIDKISKNLTNTTRIHFYKKRVHEYWVNNATIPSHTFVWESLEKAAYARGVLC